MAKITKATFKSFIKKNLGKLFISTRSSFDGMYDCTMPSENKNFTPLTDADHVHENNLGYQGIWLVGGARDYFKEYVDANGFVGIDVYNSCGHFIVAVKDPAQAMLKVLTK